MSPPTDSTDTDTDASTETDADTDVSEERVAEGLDAPHDEVRTADESADAETTDEAGETVDGEDTLPEGVRAVAFETAADRLADLFDIDSRRGETIADLETTETDQGRQLVATVTRSRRAAVRERVRSATETGRRVGRGMGILGSIAAVGYVYYRVRRRFRRAETGADTEVQAEESADITIDEPQDAAGE